MVSEDRKYLWKDIHKVVNKIGWIHKSTSRPDMRRRCIAYPTNPTPTPVLQYAAFLQNACLAITRFPGRCPGLVCVVPLGHKNQTPGAAVPHPDMRRRCIAYKPRAAPGENRNSPVCVLKERRISAPGSARGTPHPPQPMAPKRGQRNCHMP
jgi:hypothetical protein